MGHNGAKDIFRQVGRKLDNLHMRCAWNNELRAIVESLFSPDEAEVFIRLPYVFSDLARIHKLTGLPEKRLEDILSLLCDKGLVVDVWTGGRYYYMPSPMIIGIFEFTMMRTGKDARPEEWGPLFHNYLSDKNSLYGRNAGNGQMISPARVLVHADSVHGDEYTQVLDYESAVHIVNSTTRCAVGICSCRHEKLHAGAKSCDLPLETCASFGWAADYLIRHKMAREVTNTEMLENLALSRERNLVLCADNVRQRVTFICQCCPCCCNLLLGITRHGYPNTVVTSSFIAQVDEAACTGCAQCTDICPVDAITIHERNIIPKVRAKAAINEELCLGCGVCTMNCPKKAVFMSRRKQRYIHPETTFERVILQCLDKGTVQNQIFDNPQSLTQGFVRGFIQGFFRLVPVKRILLSDLLRSRFLAAATFVARKQGHGWLTTEL